MCFEAVNPAVKRLGRVDGHLVAESFQPFDCIPNQALQAYTLFDGQRGDQMDALCDNQTTRVEGWFELLRKIQTCFKALTPATARDLNESRKIE